MDQGQACVYLVEDTNNIWLMDRPTAVMGMAAHGRGGEPKGHGGQHREDNCGGHGDRYMEDNRGGHAAHERGRPQ